MYKTLFEFGSRCAFSQTLCLGVGGLCRWDTDISKNPFPYTIIFTFRSNRACIAAALHANQGRRVLLHIIIVARVQSKYALLRRAGKTDIILSRVTINANHPENRRASRQLGKKQ